MGIVSYKQLYYRIIYLHYWQVMPETERSSLGSNNRRNFKKPLSILKFYILKFLKKKGIIMLPAKKILTKNLKGVFQRS